jgi:outer membrane biosynthesis protein TonB
MSEKKKGCESCQRKDAYKGISKAFLNYLSPEQRAGLAACGELVREKTRPRSDPVAVLRIGWLQEEKNKEVGYLISPSGVQRWVLADMYRTLAQEKRLEEEEAKRKKQEAEEEKKKKAAEAKRKKEEAAEAKRKQEEAEEEEKKKKEAEAKRKKEAEEEEKKKKEEAEKRKKEETVINMLTSGAVQRIHSG